MSLVWIVISLFLGGTCFEFDDWNGWLTPRCLLIFAKMFWRWQDKGNLQFWNRSARLSVIQELTEQQRKRLVPQQVETCKTCTVLHRIYGTPKKCRFGRLCSFSNVLFVYVLLFISEFSQCNFFWGMHQFMMTPRLKEDMFDPLRNCAKRLPGELQSYRVLNPNLPTK